MKRCCTCGEHKSLQEFNRRSKSSDGRQSRCRGCSREWYEANADTHQANARRRTKRVRAENGRKIVAYLKEHPCADCNEDDFVVLDFDHLRDKTQNVSSMKDMAWSRIKEEIEKCEVVCANCHRRRTVKRGKHYQYLSGV